MHLPGMFMSSQLEDIKAMKVLNEDKEVEETSCGITPDGDSSSDDQMEVKAMVEAISAGSRREAEAHETTITSVKEIEDLRAKLRGLIEEKEKTA